MEDAAIKIAVNDLAHVGSKKAILFGKAIIVNLLQRFEMILHALIILRILLLARTINGRTIGHWLFSPIMRMQQYHHGPYSRKGHGP
jgi:hypothetical protein